MFKVLEKTHGNFIALEADGVVTMDELKAIEKVFDDAIEKYGTVHWMCIWKSATYDKLGTFYTDMMWLLKHIKKFGRMAIVGDAWWKKLLVEADGLVFGEKYFNMSRADEAWKYIEGK